MAKKELNISEFREIIREEALKLKKRIVLENEKKALMAELETINESYMEECGIEEELEEGLFGPDKSEIEANRQALSAEVDALLATVPEGMTVSGLTKDKLMQQAANSNFKGEPWIRQNKQKGSSNYGKVFLGFNPELTGIQKWASAAGSSLRGGHTFGSGTSNE